MVFGRGLLGVEGYAVYWWSPILVTGENGISVRVCGLLGVEG